MKINISLKAIITYSWIALTTIFFFWYIVMYINNQIMSRSYNEGVKVGQANLVRNIIKEVSKKGCKPLPIFIKTEKLKASIVSAQCIRPPLVK